ncbi:MAG: hypothetical protein LUD76_08575 [Alistipes sp.]|nr:hypothetical protein [Alistipes sp.]
MKMSKLNRRLQGLSSLSQLQEEREKLEYKMGMKELELEREWQEVKEAFTFSNICRTVWSRIEVSSFASGLGQGFGLVSALFRKKRDKHSCYL